MAKDVRENGVLLMPIFAAVLLEAFMRYQSYRITDVGLLFRTHGQLLLEMLPYFFAHYLAWHGRTLKALSVWLLGFVVYPLFITILANSNHAFNTWHLLGMQGFLFAGCASGLWFLHRWVGRMSHGPKSWLAALLSLDTMVAVSLVIWTFMTAGIFLHNENPMVNQPLAMIIDFAQIIEEFTLFAQYFWQLSMMALALFFVYWFNRYVLIRRLLAVQGVIPFLVGGLAFILIVSAPISSLLLLLPLNNVADFTLIPSENHNPLDPFNYQLTFWLLVFSTPIILAFERKTQDARLADIARQQTRTELQLLQQQVNPHFLFNTLNNLYALCLEKSPQAPDMVEKLAGLLRYTVYQGQKEHVLLSDDIGYLQDYLALQQLRYTEDCQFHCRWPEHAEQVEIPPLLLIIIVENAFKHGIEKARKPCELRLHIELIDNTLALECVNPLPLTTEAEVTTSSLLEHDKAEGGLGLDNLKRRLALQFANKHSLVSEARDNTWYTRLEMELTRVC